MVEHELEFVTAGIWRLHKIEEITKLQNSSNNTKKSVRLRKHAYTQTFMQLNGIYIADVDL